MLALVFELKWLLVAVLVMGIGFGFAAQRWGR